MHLHFPYKYFLSNCFHKTFRGYKPGIRHLRFRSIAGIRKTDILPIFFNKKFFHFSTFDETVSTQALTLSRTSDKEYPFSVRFISEMMVSNDF